MNIHGIKRTENNSEKVLFLRNQLVTLGDLQDFRVQLLKDFKQMISETTTISNKPWLKSCEVRKLLNISSGTLQTLRGNGTLRYNKVGGIIYYHYEEKNERLFWLLQSAYIGSRYKEDYIIRTDDLMTLTEKVKTLLDILKKAIPLQGSEIIQ
jgi:hypothetical protein